MRDTGATDRVRRFVSEHYFAPARLRGEEIIKIHSGKLAKLLVQNNTLANNRYPIICGALSLEKFHAENQLTLLEVQTPPSVRSGKSSTITFVFKLNTVDAPLPTLPKNSAPDPAYFMNLRGILKLTYQQLGGAEAFHNAERESWGH